MKAGLLSNSSSAPGAGLSSVKLFSAIVAVMALLVWAHEAVAATPPGAPTGLVGKQTGLRQITLTWDDPGDPSITGYEYCAVPTSKDSACGETGGIDTTNWHPVPGSNHRSTSHTFFVGSAREYSVSIRARNAHGLSDKAIDDEVVVHPLPEVQLFKGSHRLSRLAVAEGRQETFGVQLSGIGGSSRRPLAEVVVTIVGTGDEDVTVTPATLTFTGRNFSRVQTVTVQAARDADGDDGQTVFTLTARSADTSCLRDGEDCVSSLDMGYDGVSATLTVTEEDDNVAPVLGAKASFEVAENTVSVGTVVATDADDGDAITGYAITGGADRARLDIDASTGVLTFIGAPDYERPGDLDHDNQYLVVVEATSGSGDREWSATQAITVTVTDVAEPPAAPAVPTISAETPTGFTVTWTEPANTGPAITDYDVQYRAGTSGIWTNAGHSDTAKSLTLTGLTAETAYQVQVQATNAEGTGPWSATATGTTAAVPNVAPTFTSSATFSVAENATTVGTVTATDADALDGITGYAISGGADRALFSIVASTGALTFTSAPNYEDPTDSGTDNTYAVEVTATGGTSTRALTAMQTITVMVTDVVEPPSAPAAPTISAETPTGFTVTWVPPTNTGPAINGYEVQYRVPGGSWIFAPHSGTATNLTLGGLTASTSYQVQVRATNAEGTGVWSATATGTTTAVPNAVPTFSSTGAFSVAENATTVGTVTATDADTLDSITGYAITGGADQALFSIDGATGALRFAAAPDYENPTDGASRVPGDTAGNNEYLVVVTATSGSGDRARTATQAIAVTVTDVDEAPGAPAAVVISGETTSGFTMSWTAPANTGPEISQYIVRYRVGRSGAFTRVRLAGTQTTTTLTGLIEGTSYQVNVRARNAEGRSNWSRRLMAVTAATDVPNEAPVLATGDVFSVPEGTASVATISATDPDPGDAITGYALVGGADRSLFIIDATTGALRFAAVPDYEAPGDVLSPDPSNAAGNNEYVVVVEVTGGSGDRALTAEQTITAIVTDVDEPPGVPATPVISGETPDGFTVRWTAPANTGPAITDYDVRYRAGSSGEWEDPGHEGTGRTLALTGLDAQTAYQVQVRAENAEGLGLWSESATGMTSVLPNAAPDFDTDDVFSVSENTVSVATVSATDVDEGDGITGYAITGGADRARLSIDASTGVLSFISAPDYERPGDLGHDNRYLVVVEATGGSGDRALTATQTITVTVTDVDEPPGTPAAPTISGETPEGFTVRWTVPSNTGSAITDYDLRYRAGSFGGWTDPGHEGTGRALALTGLDANTLYQVQVRAASDEGMSAWSATALGTTLALPNEAPAFGTGGVLLVPENTTSVGTVVATDPDDAITGYALVGGADRDLLSIHPGTGALTFIRAPNYEDPTDRGRDGRYLVVVAASSGSGDRARTTEQAITVRVTDVNEPPGAPATPTISGETPDGFTVRWTAPSNTGPAITDYDVRYRAGTSGAWTNAGHEGTGLSLALTGLAAATAYRVQVRAVNAEGAGVWSEAAGETAARAPEARLPGKATGLTGEPGDRRVRLGWDALGDASVTKWQYRVRDPGRRNFHAWRNVPGSDAQTTSHTVVGGGLVNGETHEFQVRAVNGAPIGRGAHRGAGPASDVARVTVGRVVPSSDAGVTVYPRTLTIQDDARYEVVLDSRPSANVTVVVRNPRIEVINLLTPSHGISEDNGQRHSLVFTPSNWSRPQPVWMSVRNGDDGDAEDNIFSLSHAAQSADEGYDGIAIDDVLVREKEWRGPKAVVQNLYVRDGQEVVGKVLGSGRTFGIDEGDAGRFRVTPEGVLLFRSPPDFDAPTDKTVSVLGVRSPAGDNVYVMRLTGYHDDPPVLMVHVTQGAGAPDVSPPDTGSPDPEEAADAGVTVYPKSLVIKDDARYEVVLDSRPGANVTVVVSNPRNEVVNLLTPAHRISENNGQRHSLTFTPSNWSQPQPVWMSVRNGDDGNTEDDTFSLSHAAKSSDEGYDGIAVDDVLIQEKEWHGPRAAVQTVYVRDGQEVVGKVLGPGRSFGIDEGDAGRFRVTPEGIVMFRSPPDFDAPTDKAVNVLGVQSPAGDNVYVMELAVSGGSDDPPVLMVHVTREGAGAPDTDTSGSDTVVVPVVLPGKPTGLTASVEDLRVALAWDLLGDESVTKWQYRMRSPGRANYHAWRDVPGSGAQTASYTVTGGGLLDGETYEFQVRAVNEAPIGAGAHRGAGPASEAVRATVGELRAALRGLERETAEEGRPGRPQDLQATPGDGQVTLSWTAPAGEVDRYEYRYRADGGAAYGAWQDASGAATTHVVTDLRNGAWYWFEVRAVNGAGAGEPSEAVRARPRSELSQRIHRVNEVVVPRIAQAMTSSAMGAVSERVDSVASGAAQASHLTLGGQHPDAARAFEAAELGLEEESADLDRVVGESSFTLGLGRSDGQSGSRTTIWGRGDYRNLSGSDAGGVDWDADLMGAHLGADTKVSDDWLAGLSLSFLRGRGEYVDRGGDGGRSMPGRYESRLTSVQPYMAWTSGGLGLWAALGYGTGWMEVDDAASEAQPARSDLTQSTAGAGATGVVFSEEHGGGETSVRLKALGWLTRTELEENEHIEGMKSDVRQVRLAVEGEHARALGSGAVLTPSIELGLRHDGGDVESGTGLEAGGRVRYQNRTLGLTVEGGARALVAHDGEQEEWGLDGVVRVDPGASGRGWSVSVRPSWGETGSGGVLRQWDEDRTVRVLSDAGLGFDTEVGYGVAAAGGRGVLTPYGRWSLDDEHRRSLRLGGPFQARIVAGAESRG